MEVAVPSVRAQLRRCRRVWRIARNAMVANTDRVQHAANRRRVPAPSYQPGQKVWLLAWDLSLPTFSRKLAPRYVGPYVVEKVINPSALRLLLPPSLKVHPVFHVSQVKPVATSALSLPAPTPPPPRVLEGGDLVWEVSRILVARRQDGGSSTWSTGWGMDRRTGPGFPGRTSPTPVSWTPSIRNTRRLWDGRQGSPVGRGVLL